MGSSNKAAKISSKSSSGENVLSAPLLGNLATSTATGATEAVLRPPLSFGSVGQAINSEARSTLTIIET